MAINRVKIDIQGSITTFPINPLAYDDKDNVEYSLAPTIDGDPIVYAPSYDSRPRVMQWKSLPNTSTYQSFLSTLRSSVGISGVRLNFQDLDAGGYNNIWRNVMVHDVQKKLIAGTGPSSAISHLRYDIDVVFTFTRQV